MLRPFDGKELRLLKNQINALEKMSFIALTVLKRTVFLMERKIVEKNWLRIFKRI